MNLAINIHETGFEYDDTPLTTSADFCELTGEYDEVTGAPIVRHADPCGCTSCSRCGLLAPLCLGWERTATGDYICPADQDDDASVAF